MEKKNKKTVKESKFLDLKNIDKTTEAAVYYGFMPVEMPVIEKEDRDKDEAKQETEDAEDPPDALLQEGS